MKEVSINDILFGALGLDVVAFFVLSALRSTSLRHVTTFVGIFLVFVLVVIHIKEVENNILFSSIAVLFAILLNVLDSNKIDWFNCVYTSIRYLIFFWVMSSDGNYKISESCFDFLKIVVILIALSIAVLSFSSSAYIFEDGRTNGAMALGMTNSNLAGILVFFCYCLLLFFIKNRYIKWFYLLLLAYLVYIEWKTGSRTALLSMIFFTASIFVKKKQFGRIVIDAFVILPVVFVVIYLFTYKYSLSKEMIDGLFMGKQLFSGRELTYTEYLNTINTPFQIFMGNLTENYFGNAHNGPLTVFCSLGLLGFVPTYYCIRDRLLTEYRSKTENARQVSLQIFILSIFVVSCGEGSIFMGAFPSIGMILIFKALSASNIK